VSRYAGLEWPFHKRAMLFVMLYDAIARQDTTGTNPPIKDSFKIGPIADYQVPKALEYYGILRYSDALKGYINIGAELPHDSQEEVEIRIGTVCAIHKLIARINELRRELKKSPLIMAQLDYYFYSQARQIPGKHHYTRTTAY
jgi:hypothetical protein